MLQFSIKIPGYLTEREYAKEFASELGSRIMRTSLTELMDIYEKQTRDGIRSLDCEDGVRACAEAKFLTFCIGCGVLEELTPTPELMETVDINEVVETEPCPHCSSRLRKITKEYTEEPVYQVSQKGEWHPGRFDHWFCERRQAWCIISQHFRNDDSRDGLRRRFEEKTETEDGNGKP